MKNEWFHHVFQWISQNINLTEYQIDAVTLNEYLDLKWHDCMFGFSLTCRRSPWLKDPRLTISCRVKSHYLCSQCDDVEQWIHATKPQLRNYCGTSKVQKKIKNKNHFNFFFFSSSFNQKSYEVAVQCLLLFISWEMESMWNAVWFKPKVVKFQPWSTCWTLHWIKVSNMNRL